MGNINHPWLFSSVELSLLTANIKQFRVAGKTLVALRSLVFKGIGCYWLMGLIPRLATFCCLPPPRTSTGD